MAVITGLMVKELRAMTGAGILECKKALEEKDGSIDEAVKLLREKGLAKAAKKSDRIAAEGIVSSYIHGGRVGVLVEINSETDFVAKNAEFQEFAKDVAMQIAASAPKFVSRDEVPTTDLDQEKEILRNQAINEGKPANIIDKMVEGRVTKYYKEVCLLEQSFIKNPDITIQDLLNEKMIKIGEKLSIRRFARFEVGEGIEKKTENFAEEVAKQING